MSADNHASYGKIGFAVLLGAAAIAVSLVMIAGIGPGKDEILLETYYDNPVGGLAVGSPVNFRGVKVGEVRAIDFIGNRYEGSCSSNDFRKIYILMEIDAIICGVPSDAKAVEDARASLPKSDLRATVVVNSITGLAKIEVNYQGANATPPEQLSWVPEHPLVYPQPSLMENFSTAATKALSQFNRMDFTPVWSNVQSVADSLSRLSATANGLLESQRSQVQSIMRNIDSVTMSLKDLVEKLDENPSLLLRANDPDELPETDF